MNPNWHRTAACANADDPELWFPVGEGAVAQQQTEEAQAICRTCPVIEQCLTWSLETRQDVGIWGGATERDRRSIHRRKARHGAPARPERTPATVLAEHSVPTINGHIVWAGSNPISIKGATYTPGQLSWEVAHGTAPAGYVSVRCGYPGCITPDHLLDAVGRRKLHGTEAAYAAHRRRGEQPCDDCKAAHAASTRTAEGPKPEATEKAQAPAGVARCGTAEGYQAHRRWSEAACQPCLDAHRAAARTAADAPSLPSCGTRTGYDTHVTRGEAPCRPCTDARANTDWLLRTA